VKQQKPRSDGCAAIETGAILALPAHSRAKQGPFFVSEPAPSRLGALLVHTLRTAFGAVLFGGLPFLGAWRLDWLRGWIYVGVFAGVAIVGMALVEIANPALLAARGKGIRKDTKAFDKLFYILFNPLILVYPIVAGLDGGRFLWAPLPFWTVYAGAALFVLGGIPTAWAMMVNAHAEATVRIQEERNHRAVTTGPYAYVRHPIYVGTIIGFPALALVTGSGLALIPMGLLIGLFVWRTGKEDQTLKEELAGYADYAATTQYRLLPGVW
jgi:protein-S-isoprenylcysteine O-methyltransferase Ste14